MCACARDIQQLAKSLGFALAIQQLQLITTKLSSSKKKNACQEKHLRTESCRCPGDLDFRTLKRTQNHICIISYIPRYLKIGRYVNSQAIIDHS